MTIPHDNWAIYYDFVYERTFGESYNSLTSFAVAGMQRWQCAKRTNNAVRKPSVSKS